MDIIIHSIDYTPEEYRIVQSLEHIDTETLISRIGDLNFIGGHILITPITPFETAYPTKLITYEPDRRIRQW